MQISRFAPKHVPPSVPVAGVRLGAVACNLKQSGRPDLMLAVLEPDTAVAGVFTRSTTAAAPVDWCRNMLSRRSARALVVHAGNANAFTGSRGMQFVEQLATQVAARVGCSNGEVFVAATGIIGRFVSERNILDRIDDLFSNLSEDSWDAAAGGIMTTDTYPKRASRSAYIGGSKVTMTGIAKGAGMIAPDMATMLCFVFTDAMLDGETLQQLLNRANQKTFSNISIDGDTSPNDTLLLFATGRCSAHPRVDGPDDAMLGDFSAKLTDLLLDLALQVVRDGEGVQKFITVNVRNARNPCDAHAMAKAIAESPLVKSAIGGGSPNWGRVVMAVGKTGRVVDKRRLSVWFGPHAVALDGNPNDQLDRAALLSYMQNDTISVDVDVGSGDGSATVWTTDLSCEYVRINADYAT